MKNLFVNANQSRFRQSPSELGTPTKIGTDLYIGSSASTPPQVTRVLVNGESFAVLDLIGDVLESSETTFGFFHRDTRFLSRFEMKIADGSTYCVNSEMSSDNIRLRINLSNSNLALQDDTTRLPYSSIQIERSMVLDGAALFQKLIFRNYAGVRLQVPIDFLIGADFADLFEVRGRRRARRGEYSGAEIAADRVSYSYRGLDGIRRLSEIIFDPKPSTLDAHCAAFLLSLEPDEQVELEARVAASCGTTPRESDRTSTRFDEAFKVRESETGQSAAEWSRFSSSNESLSLLLSRSVADLTSIVRHSSKGTFIMAGIPCYATLFGRDSILTALFALPFNPTIAAGTLKLLAELQGTTMNKHRDEEPGKIVHEVRSGEMATTGEVPFGRYYGSVDSTPLFLLLLGRYVETTGDLELAERLWPCVERALHWIERWGDRDNDMYVEYLQKTPRGLSNQGWKDSIDAISHADGTLARPPIALCEVQGYVYAAYCSISQTARWLNRGGLADYLEERAQILKSRFAKDFWLERECIVALALDADKRPCRVISSNAAHCLAMGILEVQQEEALVDRLLSEEMFTGWGLRTLGSHERRYNPMSYHNGSVWPHDNAIAAMGFSRLEGRGGTLRILDGLSQVAAHFQSGSLPELFCGVPRDKLMGPVPYPVACHPQAWSAASIFPIMQSILGIRVLGFERKIAIDAPIVPDWLDWLKIEKIRVSDGEVSLLIRRTAESPSIEILNRHGPVTVEFEGIPIS